MRARQWMRELQITGATKKMEGEPLWEPFLFPGCPFVSSTHLFIARLPSVCLARNMPRQDAVDYQQFTGAVLSIHSSDHVKMHSRHPRNATESCNHSPSCAVSRNIDPQSGCSSTFPQSPEWHRLCAKSIMQRASSPLAGVKRPAQQKTTRGEREHPFARDERGAADREDIRRKNNPFRLPSRQRSGDRKKKRTNN